MVALDETLDQLDEASREKIEKEYAAHKQHATTEIEQAAAMYELLLKQFRQTKAPESKKVAGFISQLRHSDMNRARFCDSS